MDHDTSQDRSSSSRELTSPKVQPAMSLRTDTLVDPTQSFHTTREHRPPTSARPSHSMMQSPVGQSLTSPLRSPRSFDDEHSSLSSDLNPYNDSSRLLDGTLSEELALLASQVHAKYALLILCQYSYCSCG